MYCLLEKVLYPLLEYYVILFSLLQADVPPYIEHLCFPDAKDWPPPIAATSPVGASGGVDEQSYSLVITSETGERRFGYCRRVLPEGSNLCLPLAYCIISPFRASGFYYKVHIHCF